MQSETRYNLRIHFAPSTACVDINLSKKEYDALTAAAEEHQGNITLELSASRKLNVATDAPWLDER